MSGIWWIAVYTWREGIRKKTLVAFLILSLLVLFGSYFLGAFIGKEAVGGAGADINIKLIKDISLATISIFGVLITIFISAVVVPTEMDNRVIYTILSKPVRRFQYLLGKFLGVQFIVVVNLLLMGAVFFVALWIRQDTVPTLLLWSILLLYMQFIIVSALTFAASCASTSAVLPTIAGLFIYIVGNLSNHLKDVQKRVGESGDFMENLIGDIAFWLYQILPDLQQYSIKDQIIQNAVNDPLPRDVAILLPWLALYTLIWGGAGYVLAYWIFRRKEL